MGSRSAVRDDDREHMPPRPRSASSEPADLLEAELDYQQPMLAQIVRGDALEQTLNALCRRVEQLYPGAHCTVLLLDRSRGVLRHAASPTLPRQFVREIDGLPVGEGMGACGTAAARGEVVIVSEVMTDPLTRSFVDLAERFKLNSVWAFPMTRAGGEVVGTLAVYRESRHTPSCCRAQVRRGRGEPGGARGGPRPLRARAAGCGQLRLAHGAPQPCALPRARRTPSCSIARAARDPDDGAAGSLPADQSQRRPDRRRRAAGRGQPAAARNDR